MALMDLQVSRARPTPGSGPHSLAAPAKSRLDPVASDKTRASRLSGPPDAAVAPDPGRPAGQTRAGPRLKGPVGGGGEMETAGARAALQGLPGPRPADRAPRRPAVDASRGGACRAD